MSVVVPTKRTRIRVEIFDPLKFMFQFCPICNEPIADHEWFDVHEQAVSCSKKAEGN